MTDHKRLQEWFDGLRSRTLDLVGDYAGDELFIIDGDSLLLQCFTDETLDFTHGLQLLHATYLVERFLAQLHQRKCVFHVVFFADNAPICVPPNTHKSVWPKFQLAREAILQHLVQNLPSTVPSIQVRRFTSYRCNEFEQYLHSVGAYFLMCHDGTCSMLGRLEDANTMNGSDDLLSNGDDLQFDSEEHSAKTTSTISPSKILLRSMIHWFVLRGYNISLLNSLECKDSKVLSMILEGSVARAEQLQQCETTVPGLVNGTSFSSPDADGIISCITSLKLEPDHTEEPMATEDSSSSPSRAARCELTQQRLLARVSALSKEKEDGLTQRDWATIITIGIMLQDTSLGSQGLLEACAMLLHTAILSECKLSERAMAQKQSRNDEKFLGSYAKTMAAVLMSSFWQTLMALIPCSCDLGDAVDGTVFLDTLRILKETENVESFRSSTRRKLRSLRAILQIFFEIELESPFAAEIEGFDEDCLRQSASTFNINKKIKPHPTRQMDLAVLPFKNAIIDAHLQPVSVVVSDSADEAMSSSMSRIFQELSHWHNHKRLLNSRLVDPIPDWQKMLFNRRNQFFMADVRRYAASLTNSVGGSLDPETIFVKSGSAKQTKQGKPRDPMYPVESKTEQTISSGRRKNGQKSKPSIRDQIAINQLVKQKGAIEKHFAAWKLKVADFNKENEYSTRYIKVKQYLADLPADKRNAFGVEVLAYMTSTLVLEWKERCSAGRRDTSVPIMALVWHTIQQIAKAKDGVTLEIAECIQGVIKTFKLPALELPQYGKRSLSFNFAVLNMSTARVGVSLSPKEFQLIHAGPYMDRSIGSASDPRVQDFEPDKWQRKVLDEIDARRSLFVVAPTSAGKTFISFYAMKQILEDDNDGVLVYVAPTKALVNQIAAEVQARFSKSFNNSPGKSVWAIHTRDYRINNPTGCQVLVTVPHILQIMLLAPSNANAWSPRIKRIIFDEVHCIGQAEDGVIWEQLLLLAPCPIIALSATVGNPDEFKEWLGMAQKANNMELTMIQHKTRYSDLRKFIYMPPREFVFNGLAVQNHLCALGLDESPNMEFLHPVASLIDRFGGLPDDLTLEPRDCFMLWKAMKKHETEAFPVDQRLNPSAVLPEVIKKSDVIDWESQLKGLLRDWMGDENSPFETVVRELSEVSSTTSPDLQISGTSAETLCPAPVEKDDILDTTLPLICSLHDQGALPALFFNYDRAKCEKICDRIVTQLKQSEDHWKDTNPAWKKKLAKFEEWKKDQERQARVKDPRKKKGRKNDDDEEDQMTKADFKRETASKDSSSLQSFNPDDPVSGFHFANETKLTPSEFNDYAVELRKREVPQRLIHALERGIGVHHAGMNRKYRQVCEILFRKGYLRVVIATGTLALGINMPCKTVVFSGDSVYLTALNFRQAAGRAGRRGFDFLGNVVFQCLPRQKVCRLLSSRLPDLNGHFPITTSLVLRLLTLLHESKQAPYAVKAINSILSCPRIYLGGSESKDTVLHHLRFSIEYLRRNWLLDKSGAPLNFAGMVSHLYYTENSSFAFHALLSGGYFHRLCESVKKRPKETIRTLMLVMSHLFGRHYLRPSVLESWVTRHKSTSIVVLPSMPEAAASILRAHNKTTLSIYSAYVKTFVDQHVHDDDNILPLTSIKCGGDRAAKDVAESLNVMKPAQVTSAFIALSGHCDEWKGISQLCSMVRGGVWLEQSVIPHVQLAPEKSPAPLNAYLYDFFKHGNVHALATENMIRKGDLWFLLNDFSLVLATIVTSLENFMKLSPGTDADMLEAMGSGDALEDQLDDRVLKEADSPAGMSKTSTNKKASGTSAARPAKGKEAQVADSWDDDVGDDEYHHASGSNKENRAAAGKPSPNTSNDDTTSEGTDAVLEGKGLLQVLHAFKLLQGEFNGKFKAIWA